MNGWNAPPGWLRWRRVAPALLGLLLAINALFFSLALRPAGERALERREQLQRHEQEAVTRRENVERLRAVVANLDSARAQGRGFYQERFLPRATGYSAVIEELDKLARANNVQKGAVAYSEPEPVPGQSDLTAVSITTAIHGDYGNVVRFINQVERSPLFLVIDSIGAAGGRTAGPGPGGPGPSGKVQLSLGLVTFFRENLEL